MNLGQVTTFQCETDESNPISNLNWSQGVPTSTGSYTWQNDSSISVITSRKNGVYGGEIRTIQWSMTATKAMNGGRIRCESVYDPRRRHVTEMQLTVTCK